MDKQIDLTFYRIATDLATQFVISVLRIVNLTISSNLKIETAISEVV